MDKDANLAVRTLFKKMFDQGLIYRGDYLVNWDPVTETALADDEVEYEERETKLWHFNYPLEDGSGHLTIATTRPETMLGDVAVAVSPKDERYKALVGKNVVLPIVVLHNLDVVPVAEAKPENVNCVSEGVFRVFSRRGIVAARDGSASTAVAWWKSSSCSMITPLNTLNSLMRSSVQFHRNPLSVLL